MDIEKLMKEQWRDAETTPPAEVWDQLRQRIEPPAGQVKVQGKGRWVRWAVTAMTVGAVVAGVWALVRSTQKTGDAVPSIAQEEITSVVDEQQATATVAAMDETAVEKTALVDGQDAAGKQTPQQTAIERNPVSGVAESMPVAGNREVDNSGSSRTNRTTRDESRREPSLASSDQTGRQPDGERVDTETAPKQEAAAPVSTQVNKTTPPQTSATELAREQREAIDRLLQIPNLITPNHDGYNDCWVLKNLESLGTVQVQIYTAQSRRVFSSSNYHNDFCGDDLPNGNYFYVIVIKEKNYSRRGVLVIQR